MSALLTSIPSFMCFFVLSIEMDHVWMISDRFLFVFQPLFFFFLSWTGRSCERSETVEKNLSKASLGAVFGMQVQWKHLKEVLSFCRVCGQFN